MRPVKILLRSKRPRSRTIKVFTNVRHRGKHPQSPKQLHLGYIGLDENLEGAKEKLFKVLLEKWPRVLKPKAIDWEDAEAKLARLRHHLDKGGGMGNAGGAVGHSPVVVHDEDQVDPSPVLEESSSNPATPQYGQAALFAATPVSIGDVHMDAGSSTRNTGDLREYQEIFEQHRRHLARRAIRLTGNAEAAKDLVQDTWVRGFQRFDQFQHSTNARGWLLIILTRLFLDSMRHARSTHTAQPHDVEELVQLPELTETHFTVISKDKLAAAIGQLPPVYREVIECIYFQDMNYQETAEFLGIERITIGTRLHRARQMLKRLLDSDGNDMNK